MKDREYKKNSEWAYVIKYRAEYKCESCGSSKRLHSHHKLPKSQGGKNTLSNGICLCHSCHKGEHLQKMGYLSIEQAAKVLSCNKQTIIKNIERGDFPGATKDKGYRPMWFIPIEDVENKRKELIAKIKNKIAKISKPASYFVGTED